MRSKATTVILTALIFATVTFTASAQIPLNMSYQARLADSTGNPVPDGPYDIQLLFYSDSTGGSPVWSESFFAVNTSNGYFNVMTEPIDLGAFGEPVFMEVMVGGEILSPRSRMASVPYSAISHRIQGDIFTNEGSLVLTNADGDSSFSIMSDAGADMISVKMAHPPEQPSFEITSDGINDQISMKMAHPPEGPELDILTDGIANSVNFRMSIPPYVVEPVIEMSADPVQSSFKLMDPVDKREGFEALVSSSGHSIKLMDPVDDSVAAITMSVDLAQSSFKMIDPADKKDAFEVLTAMTGNSVRLLDPTDAKSLVEISGGVDGGASIYMFNPQPEPPAVLMEMGANPSTGASIKMFNPQPEPPEPLLEMNTTQYGATFAMTAPLLADQGDEITNPKFEVITDSTGGAINLSDEIGRYMGFDPTPFTPGGLLRMYDPVADAVKFEVSSTEDGAGIDIYDEIGKYMGFDPGPFTPGGYLYMIESTGLSVDTNLTLGSDGYIRAQNGVTIGPNTNTGIHTLVVGANTGSSGDNSFAGGRHAQADHDNCFVWSDLPFGPSVVPLQTSADNQFLVRSSGGIKFFTNASLTTGVELSPGASAWSSITILDGVRNLRPADGSDILNRIQQLPINRYSYKSEDESVEHVGPMAEDFHNQFGVGADDQHISAQDQSGIALAGIKEMISIINELKDKNAELERKIAELERQ